ncbi:HET-domain-containing protein [Xylaria sp. FL1777]|nr:HET-domain-containing protein [Xylaria sp. FL1777]
MAPRLCKCCSVIFAHEPKLREDLPHHSSLESLILASEKGCYICRTIAKSEAGKAIDPTAPFEPASYLAPLTGEFSGLFKLTIDAVPSDEDLDQWFYDEDRDDDDGFELPEAPIWGFLLIPAEDMEGPSPDIIIPTTMDLGSPEFLQMIRGWMSVCSSKHPHHEDSGFRPTRLIEITDDVRVRLVVTKGHPHINSYATLSHCWGKAKTRKLLASNMEASRAGIDISELPTSYKEGIAVCKALGIKYIWIDSLCIIQDSKEDWNREALTMCDVYSNGTINIAAAAAAESSHPSFLERDAQLIGTVEVTTKLGSKGLQKYHIMYQGMFTDEVERSPLRQRAWVVQEVFLSRRNLYLTKGQVWWECSDLVACDGLPGGVPKAMKPPEGQVQMWRGLVETYTSCQLTFVSDRMVAFAGVVNSFKRNNPGDSYEAGMWRSQLPMALVWGKDSGRTYRPAIYRAPSWSWASIEGPILCPRLQGEDGPINVVAEVLNVTSVAGDGANMAMFRGGHLQLSGHLTEVHVHDDHILIKGPDGSFNFIEGSLDHVKTSIQDQGNWTGASLDEVAESGEPMLSYLDQIGATDLTSGILETATRVTKLWNDWNMKLFSLPLITHRSRGQLISQGLLLCRLDIEAQTVYQRVGVCKTYGEVTTHKLLESAKETITII